MKTVIYMIVFSIITNTYCYSQQVIAPRLYSEILMAPKHDSLNVVLGNNKTFLPEYELVTLVALMHFQELKDTKITFKSKSINATMQARPKGLNLFRAKGKRRYIIYINTINPKVPLDIISFNAKIGVMGHELAHIIEYEQKSVWQILGIALRYANKNYRAQFESNTDQRTLNYGLRWQSYDFATYIYNYNAGNTKYLEYKKKVYMTPKEILLQCDSIPQ